MKSLYKLGLWVAVLSMATSCTDYEPLDFHVEKPESVALQEELNSYQTLKTYLEEDASAFKLGAAVSIPEYNSKEVMYRLINSNFQEVTPGYGMKHGAVVRADGTLNLAGVNTFLTMTEAAGISVFGHTLTWHANQNAGYLNGLIAPIAVTTPAFPNEIDSQNLQDGSFTGWIYEPMQVSLAQGEGMGEMAGAIRLEAGTSVYSPEDLQFTSPAISVVQDNEYEVVFYVKSDIPGEGSVAFEGLENNTPLLDYDSDGTVDSTFTTGRSWKEIRFRINDFQADSINVHLNFGYAPNVNYLVDIGNFYIYNTEGDPIVNNIVANGDFETGTGWGGWGNNSTRGITEDGMGFGNEGKAFFVTNPSLTGGFWEVQTVYGFQEPLEMGETYELSFWVKGTTDGIIRPELQSPNYSSDGFGQVYVSPEWQRIELSTTATAEDRERLILSYGEFAGTVYIDNVVLKNTSSSSGGETTIVNKTDEEKEMIIESALENWISGIMTATGYVQAWDVVNEPMDDGNPYELKSGANDTDITSDEFYWQDYLGKDYAVKAFNLARQFAQPDDLLFINDYNLEYNLDKTRGLIKYVEYIESQGARVDGIGTQMHISLDSDKDKIVEMFQLLAETGKLVKVSELDIRTDVSEPTDEILQQQADMYSFVVEAYEANVPVAQRYGITVWGVSDSLEDANWLPGEFQGLWDVNLNRKPAYKSFAEALKSL
ncbi:glycosyl hydrolase family 10 [Salegentibacter sp. 24]|uniref:endo-1,4-beta-xylanase n=1 Tax=Salegentibacter sp. 24 TaxID=2183986 RepID=UPI00105E4DE8|nr:endo-1,4-beta-xylanase [Salegentibacter sp. 24]TDN90385.1 glycosyl hydrolase family 10 [Salegentibacter sp. 24]